MTKVAALPVPVPPPRFAIEIDRALDVVEAKAAGLTREATRALALLDHLERSILTRAFRGDLVPQDPADEPAAATLASAQDGAPTTPRRGRPRRAA
jgi:type I restriction enzyme S subunit